MLQFLRKIRHQLLTENKFTKYLLYAIGEIVLVVIGIFLAIQLNNLNQDRINAKNEKNIIAGLQKEFEAADVELNADISARKNIIEISERVLSLHFESTTLGISSDSIRGFFGRFFAYRYYTTAHPVLDDLQTSGRLNLIESDKLRYAISSYIQEKNRYQIIEERERDFVQNQLLPYFSEFLDLSVIDKGGMTTEQADKILKSITPKAPLGSMLNLRINNTQQANNYGDRVKQSIEAVLAEIDSELN